MSGTELAVLWTVIIVAAFLAVMWVIHGDGGGTDDF